MFCLPIAIEKSFQAIYHLHINKRMDKQALKCFIMGLTECSDKVVRRSRDEPRYQGLINLPKIRQQAKMSLFRI